MELHPAINHFPIALSLTAALLLFMSLALRNETLRAAALWNLDLAALAGVAAVLTGIWAEESAEATGLSHSAHELLETHGALGYAAGGVLVGVAILRRIVPALKQRLVPIYLALILLAAGMVGLNSFLGGKMVFEEGVGVRGSQISRINPEENADRSGSSREQVKNPRDDSNAEDHP